jgi:hypothetical protein
MFIAEIAARGYDQAELWLKARFRWTSCVRTAKEYCPSVSFQRSNSHTSLRESMLVL